MTIKILPVARMEDEKSYLQITNDENNLNQRGDLSNKTIEQSQINITQSTQLNRENKEELQNTMREKISNMSSTYTNTNETSVIQTIGKLSQTKRQVYYPSSDDIATISSLQKIPGSLSRGSTLANLNEMLPKNAKLAKEIVSWGLTADEKRDFAIRSKSQAYVNGHLPNRTRQSSLRSLLPVSPRSLVPLHENINVVRRVPEHSLVDRIAYRIDLYISTRTGQTNTLAVCGFILAAFGGLVIRIFEASSSYAADVWTAWTFLGDSGTHTSLSSPEMRIIGIIISLIGILYFSVIMGFVVDGIREKMDNLKKGKSIVAESGHTLILGWTDKSMSLIRQICLANASEKGGVIVILADVDKELLEAELTSQLPPEERLGTRIIFRTGTPMLSVDLYKVAAQSAKSIIVMANSSGDADRSDANALRTVLSLKTLPFLAGFIVVELRDIDNEALVNLVGQGDVEILVSHDVIGRLILMAARSAGLASVFSCLLGFEGNEFYFKEWSSCVGLRFRDLLERFPNAIPLGIKTHNHVYIRPDFDTVIKPGDEIMVLAEDDDTYSAQPPVVIEPGVGPQQVEKEREKEIILICGWRRDIRDMILLLDDLVLPGTEIHMLCEEVINMRNKLLLESGLDVSTLKNITIIHHYGNTAVRRQVEALPLDRFTSIMILSDQNREDDIMNSDSHSLASLLLLRDLQTRALRKASLQDGFGRQMCKCISEILDPRTQRTISTSSTILHLSEFIQSNELISCILAMISESRAVRVILDELLGSDGAYFEVEDSSKYCRSNERLSFWQLAKRAEAHGVILCGYQQVGASELTILNPSNKNDKRYWGNCDMIVLRSKTHWPIDLPTDTSLPKLPSSDTLEGTAKSRMSKQIEVCHQALLHEQAQASFENGFENICKPIATAIQSFINSIPNQLSLCNVNQNEATTLQQKKELQELLNITKTFIITLEKQLQSYNITNESTIPFQEEKNVNIHEIINEDNRAFES